MSVITAAELYLAAIAFLASVLALGCCLAGYQTAAVLFLAVAGITCTAIWLLRLAPAVHLS